MKSRQFWLLYLTVLLGFGYLYFSISSIKSTVNDEILTVKKIDGNMSVFHRQTQSGLNELRFYGENSSSLILDIYDKMYGYK